MLSIFERWIRFAAFSINQVLLRHQSPIHIDDGEALGREVFSSNWIRADGTVRPNAFSSNRKKYAAHSLNRESLAPERIFLDIALEHARDRGQRYIGTVCLSAYEIRSVHGDDGWSPKLTGTPVYRNPFHADLPYPPDNGKDYEIDICRQLAMRARFRRVSED